MMNSSSEHPSLLNMLRPPDGIHANAPACYERTDQGWTSVRRFELETRVARVASAFYLHGLCEGSFIAIQARPCLNWLIAEWAAYRCGAVVVGVDPEASQENLAFVLGETRPLIAVTETSLQARAMRETMNWNSTLVTLASGTEKITSTLSWESLMRHESDPTPRLVPISPEHPATLIYTSGTTGQPKGIVYTHAQLARACANIEKHYGGFDASGSTICWLPMSNLFQRVINLVALANGMRLYFVDNPRDIVTSLKEVEPTHFFSVPRFFEKAHEKMLECFEQTKGIKRLLLNAALSVGKIRGEAIRAGRTCSLRERVRFAFWDRLVLRRLRHVFGGKLRYAGVGSSPMPVWLLEFFHNLGLLVLEAYGVSENTAPLAANVPSAWCFGSVGKLLNSRDVMLARDGEVLIRGKELCEGYFGTRKLLKSPDGFYHTGDLGYLDSHEFLHLVGRKTEMIKTSTGRRIMPTRIEAVYQRSPLVEQVVIFGEGRPYLTALVTVNASAVNPSMLESHDDVMTDLHERLQSHFEKYEHELATYERIRAFSIETVSFSRTRGEVTSSLKLRRNAIAMKRRDSIDRLYSNDSGAGFTKRHVNALVAKV